MAAKAEAVRDDEPVGRLPMVAEVPQAMFPDVYLFGMPLETYKMLSAAAAQRGMPFAVAMKTAIEDFLKKGVG